MDANLGFRLANLPSSDVTVLTDRINSTLYKVQLRMARKHNFQELSVYDEDSAVAAAAIYAGFPANVKDIYSISRWVSDTESVRLLYVPQRQWDNLLGSSHTVITGDVTNYTRWGATGQPLIEWYKTPTETFRIFRRYRVWPGQFQFDTSTSDFTAKDDIIIALATGYMFLSLGEPEEAAGWIADGFGMLDDAIKDDGSEPDRSDVPRRGASDMDTQGQMDRVLDPFSRTS